jgi:hypothetical protein
LPSITQRRGGVLAYRLARRIPRAENLALGVPVDEAVWQDVKQMTAN